MTAPAAAQTRRPARKPAAASMTTKTRYGAMNPALQARALQIRERLHKVAHFNVANFHALGLDFAEIRGNSAYGDKAVEKVCEVLDVCDASTAYKYITFASYWTAAELTKLLARAEREGVSLQWSHFLSLITVPEKAEREALLKHVFAKKNISGRKLHELVLKHRNETRSNPGPRGQLAGVKRLISLSDKFLEKVRETETSIVEPLGKLNVSTLAISAESVLDDCSERLRKVIEAAKLARAQLIELRKQIKDQRDVTPSPRRANVRQRAATEDAEPASNGQAGHAGNGHVANGHTPPSRSQRTRRPLPV